MEGQNHELEEK